MTFTMGLMCTLRVIILSACWSTCQSSLHTEFVWDTSVDSSQCSNTNLVFSQTTSNILACSRLCASDDTCVAMVYSPADMLCKGCKWMGPVSVPDTGSFITPSVGTNGYRKPPKDCDPGWLQLQDMCYWIGNDVRTFPEAVLTCAMMQSHIVHIDTPEENAFLMKASHDVIIPGPKNCSFIGITDQVQEGSWRFYDNNNAIIFHGFGGGEPNGGDTEQCAAFYQNFMHWVDLPCEYPCMPICEK